MKKIAMSVAAATMVLGGLGACGIDNQATDMNANNYNRTGFDAQQMTRTDTGYRGQGPVTDMMTPDDRGTTRTRTHLNNYNTGSNYGQRTGYLPQGNNNGTTGLGRTGLFGSNDTVTEQGRNRSNQQRVTAQNRNSNNRGMFGTQQRAGIGHSGLTGNNRPGMVDDDGLLRGNARNRAGMMNQRTGQGAMNLDGRSSVNQGAGPNVRTGRTNTGALGNQNRQNAMNYHEDYDSQTARRIASRIQNMNGVDDVRVIVHGNDIVVGIDSENNTNQVQQKVERKVKGLANGKDVHVVTDEDAVGRIRTMDDELRTGVTFEEVGATFNQMLGDLGRAVQRPFERSR
jgi:hypothetical protein